MLKRLAACIGLALLVWGTSCRHTYQHHQSANRHEQETRQFQTATTDEKTTHSAAAEKKTGSKRTREFDPKTGHLIRDVLEQYQSDGRVTTTASDSSHVVSTGHDFRSVKASSSSSKQTSAETRLPWFRIGLGVVVAALLVFCYFRFRAKWSEWFRRRLDI